MLDGIEIQTEIDSEKVNFYSNKYNLVAGIHTRTKNEKIVSGRSNSFKRNGKQKHFIIELIKKEDQYFLNLRGSLQKFYKGSNSGYISGFEILDAIKTLGSVFDLDSNKCFIKNIEVGINIPVWFPINDYLKSNLSYHKKQYWHFLRGVFLYRHDDYKIKIYDKKGQFLRYEIKINSIKKLKEFDIVTIADLNVTTIEKLADYLTNEWGEILMRDNITSKTVSKEQWDLLTWFTSSLCHQEYAGDLKKADKKRKESLRQEAYRLRVKCLKIINDYGNGDHQKLKTIIEDLVAEFKQTWEGDEVINCHVFPLNTTGDFVTKDNNDRSNNTKMLKKTKTESKIPVLSKKQLSKQKREMREAVNTRFHEALKNTLKKLAA